MSDQDDILKEALDRVSAPESHFWGFWRPDEIDTNNPQTVEVRLNIPDGDETMIEADEEWCISHRKTGMLFLRREQMVDRAGVKTLFLDALTLAVKNGWQFHSWCHQPRLPDWTK